MAGGFAAEASGRVEYLLELNEQRFNQALRSADFALRGFERSIGRSNPLLREFNALLTITGVSVLADSLIDAGDSIVQMDRRLATMTNTMNAVNDTALKQGEIFEFIYDTANATGQQMGVLGKALDRMLPAAIANNISFSDLKQALVGVIGALSLAGATADEKSRAFVAIGQVVGKNRLQMEELRGQLGEALPSAMLIVADGLTKLNKEMGLSGDQAQVTITKLNDLVQAGAIDGAKFIQALRRGTETYAKLAAANITLVESQYTRLSNVLLVTSGRFMQQSGLNLLFASALQNISDTIESYGEKIGQNAEQIGKRIQDGLFSAIRGAGELFDEWSPTISDVANGIGTLFSVTADGWNALPQDIKEYGIILAILGPAKWRAAIAAGIASIGLLKRVWEDLANNGGQTLAAGFEKLVTNLDDWLRRLASSIDEGIQNLIDGSGIIQKMDGLWHQFLVAADDGTIAGIFGELFARAIAEIMKGVIALGDGIQAGYDRVKNAFVDFFTNLSLSGTQSIDKMIDDWLAAFVTGIAKFINAIVSTFKKLGELFGKVWEDVRNNGGANVAQIGQDWGKSLQGGLQQGAKTFGLDKLTASVTASLDRMARESDNRLAGRTQQAMARAQEARLAAREAAQDEITTGKEAADRIVANLQTTQSKFKDLSDQALKAKIDLDKASGLSLSLPPSQREGLEKMIQGMEVLGAATGEANKEFFKFVDGATRVEEAYDKISGPDLTRLTNETSAKKLAAGLTPEQIAKIDEGMQKAQKELKDKFFAGMFGAPPDDVLRSLADTTAKRISSIDTVGKTKEQLNADVAARKSALENIKKQLADRGIAWKGYNEYVAELNSSAAQAQSDLSDKLLRKDLAGLRKRQEAAEGLYASQEEAIDAFIDLTQKPEVAAARLAEELAKGISSPYQTAGKGLDAVVSADTVAQLRTLSGELIRLDIQRKQLGDEGLRNKTNEVELSKILLENEQERARLAFEASPAAQAALLDKERVAAEARLAAARFEAVVAGDAGVRASRAETQLQTARNQLAATREEIQLQQTAEATQIALEERRLQAQRQLIDGAQALASLRDQQTVQLGYQSDMLNAQISLQRFVNDATKPLGQQMFEGLTEGLSSNLSSISEGITNVILGIESIGDVFREALKTMIAGTIQFFIEWGIRWAAAKVLQITGLAEITGAHAAATAAQTATSIAGQTAVTTSSVANATATEAAWAPAATTVSIATLGAGVAIGVAALAAAMAMMGKFHDGGISADEQIAKLQRGELVVPRSHSRMAYEMLSASGVPFGQVGAKGALGGRGRDVSFNRLDTDFVGDAMVDTMKSSRAPTIINVFDMKEVDRHMRRNPGAVVNVVENNRRNRGVLSRGNS